MSIYFRHFCITNKFYQLFNQCDESTWMSRRLGKYFTTLHKTEHEQKQNVCFTFATIISVTWKILIVPINFLFFSIYFVLYFLVKSIKETSVLLIICIGFVCSAPQGGGPTTEPIAILSQESNIEPDGSYQYR